MFPPPSLHPFEVSVEEAHRMLTSRAGWRLIDCREEDEFRLCRVEEAKLIPLSRWNQFFPDAFPAREERILTYCHHGRRSLTLTSFLHDRGYENVRSMQGGIDAWSRVIDSSIPRY